ncbi:uncharacterized protein LOC108882478 isoform X2, partial [Scomber scombrus]
MACCNILNRLLAVVLCAGALVSFLVSIQQQEPELLKHLGWTFYICCATLLYALLVTVLLAVIHGDNSRIEPAVDLSVIIVQFTFKQILQVDDMASQLQMPALGRPFTLGMLYDARKDALIP